MIPFGLQPRKRLYVDCQEKGVHCFVIWDTHKPGQRKGRIKDSEYGTEVLGK